MSEPNPITKLAAEFSSNDKVSEGELTLRLLSPSDRFWKRVFRTLMLLGLTLLSALIPIAHFVVTPLLLLCTLISAVLPVGGRALILSGEGTCPACQAPFRIMKRKYVSNFSDVCEKCSRSIVIRSNLE